jgi:hypothetical protein
MKFLIIPLLLLCLSSANGEIITITGFDDTASDRILQEGDSSVLMLEGGTQGTGDGTSGWISWGDTFGSNEVFDVPLSKDKTAWEIWVKIDEDATGDIFFVGTTDWSSGISARFDTGNNNYVLWVHDSNINNGDAGDLFAEGNYSSANGNVGFKMATGHSRPTLERGEWYHIVVNSDWNAWSSNVVVNGNVSYFDTHLTYGPGGPNQLGRCRYNFGSGAYFNSPPGDSGKWYCAGYRAYGGASTTTDIATMRLPNASNAPGGWTLYSKAEMYVDANGATFGGLHPPTAANATTNQVSQTWMYPDVMDIPVPLVLTGSGLTVGENIQHPNGNIFDQVLLTGESIKLQAKPGHITRVSFMDEDEDIVQVEYSGAGTCAVTLDSSTYLAAKAPPRYNQSGVAYVTGKPSVVIEGADSSTYFSIFTVGKINAVNQALFPEGQEYDAKADVKLLEVINSTGMGGMQLSNTVFSGSIGKVGIDARGVSIAVRLTVGNIVASGVAVPHLLFGSGSFTVAAGNPGLRITGGDLLQTNGALVVVAESASTTPGFETLISQNNFKSDHTAQPTRSIVATFVNEDGDVITCTTEEITLLP